MLNTDIYNADVGIKVTVREPFGVTDRTLICSSTKIGVEAGQWQKEDGDLIIVINLGLE